MLLGKSHLEGSNPEPKGQMLFAFSYKWMLAVKL